MIRKTFKHLNVTIPKVAEQITQDGSGKRLYRTPEGNVYPSITTVLSILAEPHIEAWRERIGNKQADFESKWACDRGTDIHGAIELVLQNKPLPKDTSLLTRMLVKDLEPMLSKIDNIHVQETPLYSDLFQIAGRCDTIGEYEGKLSVIDFKGSAKPKKPAWIENYFMQTAFYAYAYYELTGIRIPQCVIMIACEKGAAQEFIVSPKDWWKQLKAVREAYRKRENI